MLFFSVTSQCPPKEFVPVTNEIIRNSSVNDPGNSAQQIKRYPRRPFSAVFFCPSVYMFTINELIIRPFVKGRSAEELVLKRHLKVKIC